MNTETHIFSLVSLYPLPQYVVVLEDAAKTHLIPIWIGVNEGNAIALEMNGEKYPRPLTHDLFINVLTNMNVKVDCIIIDDLKDNTYFAKLVLVHESEKYEIDARPSDSLAIAVRAKCPIYVSEKVLAKCPIIDKPLTQNEIDHFKSDLKAMSPEEFFTRLESTPGKVKELDAIFGLKDDAEVEYDPDEDVAGEEEDTDT